MAVIPALRVNGVSMLPAATEIFAGTGTAEGGISSVLTVSTTSAQTGANTTETDLWTYSLPANTLSADGYGVRITAFGTYGATANDKTVTLKFGATSVVTTGVVASNNGRWKLTGLVLRTGASAQLGSGEYLISSVGSSPFVSTPAESTTGAIAIALTGQNGTAAAGDVVFRGALVEFLRAGS